MNDVENFIGNEALYKHLDINYKRCYLFEGVWGSGKTSTIRTIASKFKYNISYFVAVLVDTLWRVWNPDDGPQPRGYTIITHITYRAFDK